ncbi:MAG: T9SS type A sorting domain-containing protein, partial [Gemmatimonadetes bacterium]|nr:T9SS type A sorting domain-containing protein [Gemmatimonadota bacterium]
GEGSKSSADTTLLKLVKAADATVTLAAKDLKSYSLPFSVKNLSFNSRNVTVLVTQHQDSVLMGQGSDTLRVAVPAGFWAPGDVLHFVETVTREKKDAQGRTVIGANGQPETETVPVATFKVVLGCVNVRNSCDPTFGGTSNSGYTAVRAAGTTQQVNYFVPFRGGEDLRFEVVPAVSAQDVAAAGTVDLDNVHVVPNPYIFASGYERAAGARVLKFTNLPPDGRIRIFDLAGRFIQEINYTADDLKGGDLDWDMQSREQLELAYGLYVFVIESKGQRKMGKFVIIR